MKTWYNELGFFNNPFDAKPAAFHDDILGYDKITEDVNKKISSNNIIGLFGEYGTGKTTILKGIINKYGGKKQVIYFSKNKNDENIDFNNLIIRSGNLFQKLFKIKKTDLILLADEAQDLSEIELKHIKDAYKDGYFRAVIFVSKENDIKDNKELLEFISDNKIILGIINKEEAVNLIRKRIGDLDFISNKIIETIFEKDKNPRAFLKNCEDVCRYAYNAKSKTVKEEHMKAILKN